ncbi:MAG: Uma2 family endonuclease [Bacteroidota bacterium]
MEAKRLNNLSLSEYVAIEQKTQTKHEYHAGTIFAMSGGSIEHGLISGNTFGELKFKLRDNSNKCVAINSEVKLHIAAMNKYVYPDAMVVCKELERSNEMVDAVTNPSIIVEVLFKSTESYDRGDKFYFYRQIPSFQVYILINQYQPQVEIYTRKSDLWKIQRVFGLDQSFELPTLNISLNLSNLYEGINFK